MFPNHWVRERSAHGQRWCGVGKVAQGCMGTPSSHSGLESIPILISGPPPPSGFFHQVMPHLCRHSRSGMELWAPGGGSWQGVGPCGLQWSPSSSNDSVILWLVSQLWESQLFLLLTQVDVSFPINSPSTFVLKQYSYDLISFTNTVMVHMRQIRFT